MTATRDDVLKIKHISVVFDGFKALTDVDINIRRHDIHFFIGPNGAERRHCWILSVPKQSRPSERSIFIRKSGTKYG